MCAFSLTCVIKIGAAKAAHPRATKDVLLQLHLQAKEC